MVYVAVNFVLDTLVMSPSGITLFAMEIVGLVAVFMGVSETIVSVITSPAFARVVSLALLDFIRTCSKTGGVISYST